MLEGVRVCEVRRQETEEGLALPLGATASIRRSRVRRTE